MACFIKVCTEFLPISVDCVIQVDIHAVLDADKKLLFNKDHKKELLELVLEKAKSRLLQSQTEEQSLSKKERVAGQSRETPPEVLTGKNIRVGISFRKCGVRYNSLLATADGLGDAKFYQPLRFFKEKLIVYTYPLDQSSETSNAATASSRQRLANENIRKSPSTVTEGGVSRISEGKITSFTHLTTKDSAETVDRRKASEALSPQLVSNDISEADKFNLSAARKKKRTGDELSNTKKCRRLSQFKFRRTKAIQVLCQRASPSLKAALARRRSRVLGLSCSEKDPEEENLHNQSSDTLGNAMLTSGDVVGRKSDTHLDEKSRDIPEESSTTRLDDGSISRFKDRTINISGKNLKQDSGKISVAACTEKSVDKKLMNLGDVTTLVQCTSRNKLDEKRHLTTLQSDRIGEQDCCLTSGQKKINDKMEVSCSKASKKRELVESDPVSSALPVSKKLCVEKSCETELPSSGELSRHRMREGGHQYCGVMDKRSQVRGTEAIGSNRDARRSSTDEIRDNSKGEVTSRHNSNREIRHTVDNIRRCSSDDFVPPNNEIRSSRCEFAGSSISKDWERDWTSDLKGSLDKDITGNKHRTANNKSASESCSASVVDLCSTDTVLDSNANLMNEQLVGRDFRMKSQKRLPAQKSRRLATRKQRADKLLEGFDSSPVFIGDAVTEKDEIDVDSVPSDRCNASSAVDPLKRNCAISTHPSAGDDGLDPSPSGYGKGIPDMSTSAAHFAVEKDVILCSTVDTQPVTKRQDNSSSGGSITPALSDAPRSSSSNCSTSVTDSIGTADDQSGFGNSVARLSGCDLDTTKTSVHADVIVIDSDNEGEIDAEIKAVGEVSDLSAYQLRHLVLSNESYLREIFQGKRHCRRHEDYKAGKERRRALSFNLPVGVFSDERYNDLLSALKELFCKRHEKYLDYLMLVLLPEMLVKIYMFIHDVSYEEAELRIEEIAMQPSQIDHFTF